MRILIFLGLKILEIIIFCISIILCIILGCLIGWIVSQKWVLLPIIYIIIIAFFVFLIKYMFIWFKINWKKAGELEKKWRNRGGKKC